MKKITFLLLCCLTSSICFSTRVDFNGVNFGQYADENAFKWLTELVDAGDTIGLRLRVDKTQSLLLEQADIDAAIEFHKYCVTANRVLDVIFTANLWATPETNLSGINQLISAGVLCNKVELGNEWYSNTKDATGKVVWETYINIANPIAVKVKSSYPNFEVLIPTCPNPSDGNMGGGRKDHETWNTKLAEYLSTKDYSYGCVYHIYYNQEDFYQLRKYETGLPKVKSFSLSSSNTFLNTFFTDMYDSLSVSDLHKEVANYVSWKFPKRNIYITEYGIGNTGSFRNTIAYSSLIFEDYLESRSNFKTMGIHSGVALTGIIRPKNTKFDLDSISTSNVRTCEYWALKLALQIPKSATEVSDRISIQSAGQYFFYFRLENSGKELSLSIPENCEITFIAKNYIGGKYIYSSAGYVDYLGTGSSKTYEVNGVKTDSSLSIPLNSYGYFEIIISEKKVYGCTDPKALNYNSKATDEDNSCQYPEPTCLKKRLFKPGCKEPIFKTNCNCE